MSIKNKLMLKSQSETTFIFTKCAALNSSDRRSDSNIKQRNRLSVDGCCHWNTDRGGGSGPEPDRNQSEDVQRLENQVPERLSECFWCFWVWILPTSRLNKRHVRTSHPSVKLLQDRDDAEISRLFRSNSP